jgi:hypothetical protein
MRVELENLQGLDLGYMEFPDDAGVPRQGERIRHESSSATDTFVESLVHDVTWLTKDSALVAVRLVVESLPVR